VSGGNQQRGWTVAGAGLAVLLVLVSMYAVSVRAELPAGLPPLLQIPPDPDFHPGFYSVAQSPDGLLHVGGRKGIHSHDGRRWQFMAMPNADIVRSLLHDGADRLYVGGYGMFGYARMQPDGTLQFIDLTPSEEELPGDGMLADIWSLLIAPEGVYFSGVHHLFLYEPNSGRMRTWYHDQRFGVLAHHGGQTLVQFRDIGLKRFNGEGFELVKGGEYLQDQLYALLPLPDGGLVTLGRDGQWLKIGEGPPETWSGSERLPTSDSFSAWLTLPNGTFALGGPDGSLHLVDPETLRVQRIEIVEDYVADMALANDGGLLVQSDSGTVHVNFASAWTRIGADSGLRGRVHKLVREHDHWVAVTNAGVHRSVITDQGRLAFRRTQLTPFEAWDWISVGENEALLADSYSLVHVRGEQRQAISSGALYPRLLKRSRFDPDILYVGTELGISVFHLNGESWSKRFNQEDFTGRVVSLLEVDRGRLLAAVDGHGLIILHFDEGFRNIEHWSTLEINGQLADGDAGQSYLFRFEEEIILASTKEGFFEWNRDQFRPTELAGLIDLPESKFAYRLRVGPDGSWWAYTHDRVLRRAPGEVWKEQDLVALNPGVISWLGFAADGRVLLGGTASILKYDQHVTSIEFPPPSVALRAVWLTTSDGQVQRLPLDGQEIRVAHDLINMVFEYALPSYRRPELTRYKSRMLGYEDHFGDWGNVTRITFSRLKPGQYQFEVRARDWQGHISRSVPFDFRVLPPWYSTLPARLLWVIMAAGLMAMAIWSVLRWRFARVNAERTRLKEMVERRTFELAAANRRLEDMANVDGLTSVANRRRLDQYMNESWSRCAERNCELSVILLDVDHFKKYNDTHGHQAGDEILRRVAGILSAGLRRSEDIVGRYGGEEFMCILPRAPAAMAMEVAELMRDEIERACKGITVSIGVATAFPGDCSDARDLIERADRALYAAKQAGRNRIFADQ
jgi:diguanylate cyclase (GGDEF)-like protein